MHLKSLHDNTVKRLADLTLKRLDSILEMTTRCISVHADSQRCFGPICLMHHLFWTSGHNGGVVAVPRCNFSIDCRIPACLSLIRHTSGRAATTWIFTHSRNQYQLSMFSFSTNTNASGTIWLLQYQLSMFSFSTRLRWVSDIYTFQLKMCHQCRSPEDKTEML